LRKKFIFILIHFSLSDTRYQTSPINFFTHEKVNENSLENF